MLEPYHMLRPYDSVGRPGHVDVSGYEKETSVTVYMLMQVFVHFLLLNRIRRGLWYDVAKVSQTSVNTNKIEGKSIFLLWKMLYSSWKMGLSSPFYVYNEHSPTSHRYLSFSPASSCFFAYPFPHADPCRALFTAVCNVVHERVQRCPRACATSSIAVGNQRQDSSQRHGGMQYLQNAKLSSFQGLCVKVCKTAFASLPQWHNSHYI